LVTSENVKTGGWMAADLAGAQLGRALAARRRTEERDCPVCGSRFIGTTRRIFCSPSCATRTYWARHGA